MNKNDFSPVNTNIGEAEQLGIIIEKLLNQRAKTISDINSNIKRLKRKYSINGEQNVV